MGCLCPKIGKQMYQYFSVNEKQSTFQSTSETTVFSTLFFKLLMRFHLFFILFLVLFLQTATALHGQNKINLHVKAATLEEVLQHVRAQSGYDYVIRPEHNKKFTPVTFRLSDMELSTMLQLCFQGQPLGFVIQNKTIIVTDSQQERTITGVVADNQQVPLAGATVRIKNTTLETRTDDKGVFTLDNVPPKAILEISYVGYEVRQIDLSATDAKNLGPLFILKQQIASLDEITVLANTGYQKLDPSKATGSMVVIDAKKIQESPALSLMQRLEGQISGVQFNMKDNRLMVRSPNNFSSSSYDQRSYSSPLIIIDGFPAMEQQLSANPTGAGRLYATNSSASILNNFNPDDIASITVLKDAAAASIWGSRAANGVIVIETKAGRGGRNTINFSSTFGTTAPPDLNNLRTMNAAEYIEFEKELYDNKFFPDPTTGWRYGNLTDALNTMFQAERGEISMLERDAILTEMGTRNNRNQIRDNLLQHAQTQQYNLSFNGAVGGAQYYASAVHAKDRPIYKENSASNTSLTFNINNAYFNNKLKVSLGLNQTIQKSTVNDAAINAIKPGTYGLRPYDMLLDANGNSKARYYTFTPAVTQERFESQGYLPWTYNHIDELQYNNDQYDNNLTRITGSLNYKALSWLNASLSGSYQRGLRNMESLRDKESHEMRSLINTGTTIKDGKLVYGVPMGGKFVTSNNKSDEYSVRFQLDAAKTWNEIHQLDLFAGSEIRQTEGMGYLQTRYGFDSDTYQSVAVNPIGEYLTIYGSNQRFNIQDAPINISRQRFLSYYANGGYTLMNRYYLTGSIRFDDATLIGVDRAKRAKPFWSTGIRWDIHQEAFMSDLTWLDQLSIRSSIGTGGSVPTQGTSFTVYQSATPDPYTQLPNGYFTVPANQMLGWETTRSFNTGLDFSLFKSRFGASVDVYSKRSYGIVANVPYNSTYGWSFLSFNTSNMKSSGIDVQLHGDIVRTPQWKWNSSINFAYTTNEVTDNRFPNTSNTPGTASSAIEGYPIDQIFAYRWAGLDNKGRSQVQDQNGNIIDADGSTFNFTPEDLRYMGRLTAPYFGGWSNNVSYKNFTFTARVTANFGHKVRWREVNSSHYPNNTGGFSGFLSNSKALVDRWRQPGDEARTHIPGVVNTNFNSINRFAFADINVINASHIRLQQLSLNYDFPAQLLNQNKVIKSMSIGVTAANLGILWKKSDLDIDPEYMFDGQYQSMPPVASYLFRLNVGF
ncbi:SusC/RagA family TonB-linked outer membrane protein [Sphingobacterium sp. Ka21]|uniref:SusC/RagA family TonB-linked outer membrane protein n=2 Tax=Sphingobacterium pedocola TaxID=2082722 RepID=A0ABR9TC53_9SPHI|nr:SusC/RagA family TonB-linked outer membrane protein [Sphingobacterium pedocola]